MGVYQYDDPITGEGFDFTIKGDTPSNTEFAKISQIIKTNREAYGQQYQDFTGQELEIDDETAVRRGLRRGYQQIKGAVGETLGTAGEQYGLGFLADYGQDVEERARQRLGELLIEQPERMQSTDVDSIGSALTYAGELVGEQIPQLGLGLGAAAIGTAVAPAAPFIAGVTAAGLTTAPILFGNNIQRQEDEVASGKKASVDVGAALRATFGQAALEGIADKILLGGMLRPLGKSIFTRTASRATGGATTEGLTEVGQQIMERAQAGLPIDSEDAIAEYREAAIAGGLIGGGTRATFGAFQGVPETEAEKKARLEAEKKARLEAERAAAITTEAGAEAAAITTDTDIGTDPTDATQPEADKVEETIAAAEEITAVTDAQATEARNAADSTPPKGKAEQTDTQRAVAAADVDTSTDKQAAIAKEARLKQEEALRKTEKYIKPAVDPNAVAEDRDAALKSEQSGENIQVGVTEEVEVDAVTTDPDVIDDDFLSGLSVPKMALIRRKNTKISLIGKKKNDPAVIEALKKYALTSSIPAAKQGVTDYLNSVGVSLERKSDTERPRVGVPSDQPSVVGGLGRDSTDTEVVAEADVGRLGTDLPPARDTADTTGIESDTLEDVDFVTARGSTYSIKEGNRTKRNRASNTKSGEFVEQPTSGKTIYMSYEDMNKFGSLFQQGELGLYKFLPIEGTTNEAQLVYTQDYGPFKAGDPVSDTQVTFSTTPEVGKHPVEIYDSTNKTGNDIHFGSKITKVNSTKPKTAAALEELKQQADIATAEPVAPAPQPATPAMQQAAIGGAETGLAGQVIPEPVQVPAAPPMQAAPVPQEQLQAVEAERDAAAQARIDRIFQSNRGKQPQVREYHDTQVDPRSAPEVTTAVDKEGVAELLETPDKDLDTRAKAAKLFFKRFRRPVDALAEMGAVSVNGPIQQALETKKISGGKVKSKKAKEKEAGRFYYAPKEFAFYKGMTQEAAMDARKWVFDNLSRQAFVETRDASVLARRNTAKYSPSDAYIAVTKAAKSIQRKDDRAFNRQMDRELDALKLEAKTRAPAAPDQEMRAEGAVGATELIKGETTFDSYLLGLGFKKRKVTTTVERDGKKVKQTDYVFIDPDTKKALTDEELMDFYDSFAYTESELGFLLIDPVHGLDQALLPSIRNALQRGDLGFALDAIASTSQVDRIREIAAKLANVVGDTQVQVVDDLSQVVGRTAAGLFDPETNTIQIDANRGMNVHTILHEMTHAATSAAIANPSLPETKQLQTLLNAAREQFGEVYGTQNLDEFVAEAFSNPEFQSALALTRVDGGKMSGWEKFTGAVKRIVRKLLGLSPSPSALTEIDSLIDGMLAPSPATRAAPNMLLEAGTKEGSGRLLQSIANFDAKDKVLDAADVMLNEGVGKKVKSFYLDTLPVNILTEKAKSKIPFARELNTIINRMSGRLREKTEILDSMSGELKTWQRMPKNKKHSQTLNNLIPRSTFLRVDPSRTDEKYMKTINESREKQQEYKALRTQYLSMDKKGQEFYRQLRNYFQDTYNDILAALDARLEATIPDAEARKTAFARLRELLQKDSGIITPYFPLQRKGGYRLAYTASDPDTGQPELFVEYYPTLRKAQQARDLVSGMGGTDTQITEASKAMNFDRAPSTSFVRNVLETVQLQRSNFKTDEDYKMAMQAMVDLALDAMPERSFMQNFRRRKGIRGFIGDTTPTGILGQEFDAYTMLKEKGRDLNRQLVQMRSAAEIEGFRKKLADPEAGYTSNPETAMVADKLDQIAKFAQSPNVPRWSQIATSVGFGMTMGLNFSSAAITFFDVAMSAMPILAGKHGIRNTTSAYGDAMRALMGAPTVRTVMVTGPDGQPVEQEVNMGVQGKTIANYTPEQLLERFGNKVRMDILVESGLDQAQFNQSITQENLEVGRGADLETMNRVSSFLFHHSERINREATLTAAYLLEVKKLLETNKNPTDADYKQAAQNAIDDTEFTLGATAAAGRPIVAQSGIGNVLFLFKRFAISKYYMMERLARDAAKGDKVALAQARNFLVMTGLLSGLGGMPLMGAIGAIFNILRDDDEDDFEAATRKLVGEGIYGGLANELLGVDVANRISLNSLLYRAPIIDKDQSALWTLAEQLGGPVLGVGLQWERGLKDIYAGETRRGFEAMLPAAFRNLSKAERFLREGAETRRGDPITEDINPYNIAMQGLGFAPQGYIQQLEFNKNNRRRQEAINSDRSKLLRQRNMAMREGDFEEVRNIDRKIEEFNKGLPKGAEKSRITADTKSKSLRAFGRTTDKMRGGMTYTPFMERSLKEYDQGFQLF